MSWSAEQYTKFEDERTRPVRDLIAQIPPTEARNVADIGCGPGNSTELLQARFPQAAVTGIDSSVEMIAAARKRLPAIHFEIHDISAWQNTKPFDVILSNAALQWVPDHAALLPALLAKLAPGGSLAVQIPDNLDEPALRLMRELASDGPWAAKLVEAKNSRVPRHGVDWYYRALYGRMAALNVWQTTFYHSLAGGIAGIVEWFKGSGLRPYLAALAEDERHEFLTRYEAALAKAYPLLPDGSVVLPFPRLFFVATRA